MKTYERLDSWKACHALTLAVFQATKSLLEQDPGAADRLRLAALLSASKLARGAGTGNWHLLRECAGLAAGYLSEFGYHLELSRVMGLLPDEVCAMLDALRGRAAFYTWKHLTSRLPASGMDRPDDPEAEISAS